MFKKGDVMPKSKNRALNARRKRTKDIPERPRIGRYKRGLDPESKARRKNLELDIMETMSTHHSGNAEEARNIIRALNDRFVIRRRRNWSITPWISRTVRGIMVKIKW